MLDGVVLGAVRWIVRSTNRQTNAIRQFLKRPLEDMPAGGIAAPAVTQEQQAPGSHCGRWDAEHIGKHPDTIAK